MVQLWKELAPRQRSTNLKFIRLLQEGDFGMAPQVTELTGIPFDDFQTPYTLDVHPVKRGIAFAVSSEAVETDQIGVNRNVVPKIARASKRTSSFSLTRLPQPQPSKRNRLTRL